MGWGSDVMYFSSLYNYVGDNADQFTVEVHYGGFFVGSSYLDEKISWFDYCEADKWSTLWFDDIIEELGYEKSIAMKVLWLQPRNN
jgi:hypothetical protein